MKRITQVLMIITLLLLSIFLCVWLGSIARCEYLTIRYGEQFQDAYLEHTMLSQPDYLKLLEYSEDRAVVYYVKSGSGGDILILERDEEQSEWGFVNWITIWSKSGSADDFVWPYIR